RELADRDAHAAGALVAEAENALAVAHHDRLDLVEARVRENILDPIAMRPAQEQATRLRPGLAEALAALADGRRVDQRQRLRQVPGDDRVEQRLVGVLQPAQEDIALE